MAKHSFINVLSIPITSIVDFIGYKAISSILYIQQIAIFTWQVLWSFDSQKHSRKLNRKSVINQIIFSGIDALPTITILSLAIAFSVTSQLILILQSVTTEREVIQILSQIIAQELAPLLTAIIIIGRSGSAITVDLGNMLINRELKALELLGINIKEFFALPRILGVVFSQFTLTVYFAGIVMVGGIIFSALIDSPSNYKYLFILVESFTPSELMIFVIKNICFGLIIGSIACFHGLRVHQSRTELPQQTQQGIVNSLIFIFIFDGLLALI